MQFSNHEQVLSKSNKVAVYLSSCVQYSDWDIVVQLICSGNCVEGNWPTYTETSMEHKKEIPYESRNWQTWNLSVVLVMHILYFVYIFHILLSPWLNFGSMECMTNMHACIMYVCVCTYLMMVYEHFHFDSWYKCSECFYFL